MKKPTEYRIVYVLSKGLLRNLMSHGQWWPIRHDETVANHIMSVALAGVLFDIEVR